MWGPSVGVICKKAKAPPRISGGSQSKTLTRCFGSGSDANDAEPVDDDDCGGSWRIPRGRTRQEGLEKQSNSAEFPIGAIPLRHSELSRVAAAPLRHS
eukprot:4919043-Pyramimonas_sp.AAC.1